MMRNTLAVLMSALALAGSAGASGAGGSEEVLVSARRAELAPRVSAFVNEIAAVQNEDGLPRWQAPVCPLVKGLPSQEGEFILGRISEVARAAAVPLGDEHCTPNLYILVTTQPNELLKGMQKQNRTASFGGALPSVVDEFIATQRPVRVWYNSSMKTSDGMAETGGMPLAAQIQGAGGEVTNGTRATRGWDNTSHITHASIWAFSYVYVVIDQKQLQGVSRGQLADYLAMVSLADIKPGAHLADSPSILKLFDGAPAAAPAGMSAWDQAFITSLYATEQKSRQQRNNIASNMVRDIIP